jgi:hypothetical protein
LCGRDFTTLDILRQICGDIAVILIIYAFKVQRTSQGVSPFQGFWKKSVAPIMFGIVVIFELI